MRIFLDRKKGLKIFGNKGNCFNQKQLCAIISKCEKRWMFLFCDLTDLEEFRPLYRTSLVLSDDILNSMFCFCLFKFTWLIKWKIKIIKNKIDYNW